MRVFQLSIIAKINYYIGLLFSMCLPLAVIGVLIWQSHLDGFSIDKLFSFILASAFSAGLLYMLLSTPIQITVDGSNGEIVFTSRLKQTSLRISELCSMTRTYKGHTPRKLRSNDMIVVRWDKHFLMLLFAFKDMDALIEMIVSNNRFVDISGF